MEHLRIPWREDGEPCIGPAAVNRFLVSSVSEAAKRIVTLPRDEKSRKE